MYLSQHNNMYEIVYLFIFTILVFSACTEDEPSNTDDGQPVVQAEATFSVLFDEDITYANGLGLDAMNTFTEIPQLLDVYHPENNATNRPVFMFIHGGGFTQANSVHQVRRATGFGHVPTHEDGAASDFVDEFISEILATNPPIPFK